MKAFITGVAVILLAVLSTAQIPSEMSYQGYLTDSNGDPITNPIFPMEFGIYADSLGSTSLWNSYGVVLVDVNDGYFTHPLGSSIPLPDSLSNYSSLWLGVKAGGDSEMPLIKIISTGYSYKALEAAHALEAEYAVHADSASYSTEAGLLDGFNADAFSDTSHGHPVPDTVNFAHRADTANVALGFASLNVPIGSVLPWLKNFPGCPSLPGNFVECNGQVLDDPNSPFNEQTIPDLNGESRFLRGSSTSGNSGGSDTHYHANNIPVVNREHVDYFRPPRGDFISLITTPNPNTSTDSSLPPYYEVVWVIRIK